MSELVAPAGDEAPSGADAPTPSAPLGPDDPRGAQRNLLATLAIAFGLLAVILGTRAIHRLSADATPEECEQLLERYTEQNLRAVRPDAPDFVVAQHKERAHVLASRSEVFRECTSRLTRSQVECAAQSGNADEFERCVQ